jgi:hypothetical protein
MSEMDSWLVTGDYEKGKFAGWFIDRPTSVSVQFRGYPCKSFFLRDYRGSREAARLAAEDFRARFSNEHGFTKNRIRHLWAPHFGEDWLEVELTQGHTMWCDAEFLDLVEKYTWNANKHPRTFYARAHKDRIDRARKSIKFHRKVINAEKINHISGNGLDNRKANLEDTTITHNARQHKLSRRNTSNVAGVSFNKKLNAWVAKWNEDDGRCPRASFSLEEHGEQLAFGYACAARQEAEIRLGIAILPD